MLKNTDNDEIIIKGDQNRAIWKIWQQKEEDVLFEQRFIRGDKFFEDISFYNSAKLFIQQHLQLEDDKFFSKDISAVQIQPKENLLKIKLAFFYIKSIDNISFIQKHIL